MFILFTGAVAVHGQYTKEFKRIFFDADYLLETEFYEEAFNRFKNLLTLDPGNSNILFLCGACCLNIPGSEELAITYLQEAAEGVNMTYKEHSPKESNAPVYTYFMLGRAYHLHNEFDKAVENYERYLELGTNQDPLQLEYARLQIAACSRASELLADRPAFEFQDVLDQFDDDLPSCSNPVISGDGNMLIFLVDYPSDKKIMMSTQSDQYWSRPRVINSEIGMVGETYPVSLSYDGTELYLMHQYYSHSDIFVSRLEGRRWTEAEGLGRQVNGRTSETHASISRDGQTLYFTSDARGGQGSFDIYVTHLDEKGEWGPPTNLGPVINTPYEEHTPFISSNDSILFFSSQGHASIGGIDVFYSELNADGIWSEPVNLGYPVNTTADNLFFNPGWDELDGYYAVRRMEDPTSNTINMVIELEPEPEVLAEVTEPADAVEEVVVTSEPADSIVEMIAIAEPVETVQETEVSEAVSTPPEEVDTPPEEIVTPSEEIPSLTTAIEPEETDEIQEVLNRGRDTATAREILVEQPDEEPAEQPVVVPLQAAVPLTELKACIPFEHNSFELNLTAQLEVEKLVELLQANPGTTIELTGHADATGDAEYNMLLSFQRADQVANYLTRKGVNPDRISIHARGEEDPVARNWNPDGTDAPLGRYLNRLVTVNISGPVPGDAGLYGVYVPKSLRPDKQQSDSEESRTFTFTIQLMANLGPINPSRFRGVDDVDEHICIDAYYRYTCGEFRTAQEAREALMELQKMGYEDAFIQTREWYLLAKE